MPLPRLRGTARRHRLVADRLAAGARAYAGYGGGGNGAALDRAINSFERARRLAGPRSPHRLAAMANLGAAQAQRAELREDPDELDHAIALLEQVLAGSSRGQARSVALAHLGSALLGRRKFDAEHDDLLRATQVLSEVVTELTTDTEERARCSNNLGIAWSELFLRDGHPEYLDRALVAYEASVDSGPDARGDRGSNLATGLAERYELYGDPADLDRAIVLMRAVTERVPDGSNDAADRRENLALALRDRHLRDGDVADLEESIAVLRAVVASSARRSELAGPLDQLAVSLRMYALRTRQAPQLQEAAALHREAAELATADGARAMIMSNLAGTLRAWGAATEDAGLVEEGVVDLRAAAHLTSSVLDRAAILTNLGNALLDRAAGAAVGAGQELVREAVRVTGESLDLTAAGSPLRPGRLNNHALAWAALFEHSGRDTDRRHAFSLYRESCALLQTVGGPDRLRTAQNWCDLASRTGCWDEAYAALPELRAAADEVLSTNLSRPHRAAWLTAFDGLAAGAAAVSVRVDRPGEAVEWLEWSRVKLALTARGRDWGQLAALAQSHADLAGRYRRLAERIRALESLAANG
jgi:hypothetical protein